MSPISIYVMFERNIIIQMEQEHGAMIKTLLVNSSFSFLTSQWLNMLLHTKNTAGLFN